MAHETSQQPQPQKQQGSREDTHQYDASRESPSTSPRERPGVRSQAPRTDRERSIDAARETGRRPGAGEPGGSGLARRPSQSPAYGRGVVADPFSLMQRMAEDMDRLFDQFGLPRGAFGATPSIGSLLGRDAGQGRALAGRGEQSFWSPPMEMFQRGDQLVIRADLPGMRKEHVHIDIEDDVLTLRGERREESEERREGFYRSERSYGSFHRAIALPDGIDAERCEASYRDGVLEITLPSPKEEERRPRRVEIR